MNLLLISETAIIEQIFSLVCKKLNIELTVTQSTDVSENYDLIIVDQNFINDKFNVIKQYSKKLGAISSEELPFDKSRDFIIPRPFLPTKLQEIINEQLSYIKEDEVLEKTKSHTIDLTGDNYEEDDEVTLPVTSYVESLADNVYSDIEDESDESIVSLASLRDGGVLDTSELSKINQILEEDNIHDEISMDKQDWKDISDIIDDALEEVREYEFDLDSSSQTNNSEYKPLKLVLSNYNIDELRPLLEKFDQTVIDRLSSGESVDLRLILKENS